MTSAEIIRLIKTNRLSLANEKALQREFAAVLSDAGIEFLREHRLGSRDIIDFMIGGMGIEMKLRAPRLSIYRQCERYCGYDEVQSLVLATNTAMGMPSTVAGKPVFVVYLGTAWL